eukprot:COSAG06_NODE_6280_length_3001_cov_2.106134_4_plen_70_part_00
MRRKVVADTTANSMCCVLCKQLATPGSIALLRLKSKLQILETVLRHGGVLQMNGPPITRTFREVRKAPF